MSEKKKKPQRLKARLPRGFADRTAADIRATEEMLANIKRVFELYGFDPVETPMFEYTDALGKFLPDQDRPNEGVFSLQDDDEQWLSLRYDLTAPLARHVAENINTISLPYRTYRAGWVYRNEKPGPGRFRQFMQFDADTVGAPGVQADAEMAMMMADTMEALGLRGQYLVKINSRQILDGVLDAIGLGGANQSARRLKVLRSLDKFDRIGSSGVKHLLMQGRVDESGDFTEGAGLDEQQVEFLLKLLSDQLFAFLMLPQNLAAHESETYEQYVERFQPEEEGDFETYEEFLEEAVTEPMSRDEWVTLRGIFVESESTQRRASIDFLRGLQKGSFRINRSFREGIEDLTKIVGMCADCGYSALQIRPDVTVVRGLEYYTGPVFECELTFPVVNEKGETVVFGSVAGGGRYDGLVKRFTGQDVPATGFSIGVSRLMTALKNLGKLRVAQSVAPILVTVMDRDRIGDYMAIAKKLREGLNPRDEFGRLIGPMIPVEMYQGNPKNFGNQLKYADRRGCPIAVIQGSQEREAGRVQLKDLIEGKRQAEAIASNVEWREARPGQFEIAEADLVSEVKKLLAAQASDRAKDG